MTSKETQPQGNRRGNRVEQGAKFAKALIDAVVPKEGKPQAELSPIERLRRLVEGPNKRLEPHHPHRHERIHRETTRLNTTERPKITPQDAQEKVDQLVQVMRKIDADRLRPDDRAVMGKALQEVALLDRQFPNLKLKERAAGALRDTVFTRVGLDRPATRLDRLMASGQQGNGDLFDGLDGAIAALPPEYQREASAIRKLTGSPDVTDGQLSGFHRDFSEMIEHASRTGQRMTPDQRNAIYTLQDRLLKETYRRRESERVTSSIVISPDEVEAMSSHSLGAMDKWVTEQLEAYIDEPDGAKAKGMLHRIQLKLDLYLSDHFDFNQVEVRLEGVDRLGMTPEEWRQKVQDNLKMLKVSREDYLKEYTIRSHLAQFHQTFKNAAEVGGERFMGLINNMNERDWFAVDAMYGGLVGDAYQVLLRKYEAKIWDVHGNKQGLEPNAWSDAIKETQEYMKANREQYEPKYMNYLQGKYLEGVGPGEELFSEEKTKSAIAGGIAISFEDMRKHIVELAAIRGDMWLDHQAVNIRGLSPLAHEIMSKKPSGYSYTRKAPVESIKRLVSFHPEIWGSTSGRPAMDKAFMRHHAKLWVNATPDIEEWAGEQADVLWERLQHAKHALHTAGGKYESLTTAESKRLIDELRSIYLFSNDFKGGGAPGEDEMVEYAARLGKSSLYEDLLVRCGLEVAESHMLRPYFSWESTWRRNTVFDEMERRLNEVAAFRGNADKLFMSKALVGAASAYYKHKFTGDPREKQTDFLNELKKIAAYRPHDLAIALLEKEDGGLIRWFDGQHIEKSEIPKMLSELGLRASVMNRMLLQELNMPVKYAGGLNGLTEAQRRVIERIFTKDNILDQAGMTRHFEFMQALTKALQEGDRGVGPLIKKFLSIRYEPLLTVPRFSDDLPLDLLEHPERMGLADGAHGLMPISEYVSGGDWDPQSGMMRRMWRDLSLAEKGKTLIWQSMRHMKDEDLAKLQKDLWDIVAPYQGENHAGMAVVQNLAAWLGMARAYKRYGRFFEGRANSSDFKRYGVGDLGSSMSADQLSHVIHVVENQAGKIHVNAPETEGVFNALLAYTGISNWGGILSVDLHINPQRQLRNWLAFRQGYDSWSVKLLEKTGIMKWAHRTGIAKLVENFIANANESTPSGVFSFKGTMLPLYFLLLLGIYTATVAGKETKEQASGGN